MMMLSHQQFNKLALGATVAVLGGLFACQVLAGEPENENNPGTLFKHGDTTYLVDTLVNGVSRILRIDDDENAVVQEIYRSNLVGSGYSDYSNIDLMCIQNNALFIKDFPDLEVEVLSENAKLESWLLVDVPIVDGILYCQFWTLLQNGMTTTLNNVDLDSLTVADGWAYFLTEGRNWCQFRFGDLSPEIYRL